MNQSLAPPKGKLAAQVAHGAVGAFVAASTQAQAVWVQHYLGLVTGDRIAT